MTYKMIGLLKLMVEDILAGDYGSTFSLSRTFNNGWEIGAYATLTDVKFSTFGEGSFDKGITLKATNNLGLLVKNHRSYAKNDYKTNNWRWRSKILNLSDENYLYYNIAIL